MKLSRFMRHIIHEYQFMFWWEYIPSVSGQITVVVNAVVLDPVVWEGVCDVVVPTEKKGNDVVNILQNVINTHR